MPKREPISSYTFPNDAEAIAELRKMHERAGRRMAESVARYRSTLETARDHLTRAIAKIDDPAGPTHFDSWWETYARNAMDQRTAIEAAREQMGDYGWIVKCLPPAAPKRPIVAANNDEEPSAIAKNAGRWAANERAMRE